jgi:hypothetical protein
VPSQDRQGVLDVVAVTVVEGERQEGRPAGREPRRNVVERNEREAELAREAERAVEMLGRDLQERVRPEGVRPLRPDVMEGQDEPGAAREQPQGAVGPRRRDRPSPAPINPCLKRPSISSP